MLSYTWSPCISWFHNSRSPLLCDSVLGLNFLNCTPFHDFEKKDKKKKENTQKNPNYRSVKNQKYFEVVCIRKFLAYKLFICTCLHCVRILSAICQNLGHPICNYLVQLLYYLLMSSTLFNSNL